MFVLFLINVLCSLVPCDPSHNLPDIDFSNAEVIDLGLETDETHPIVWTENGGVRGYFMLSSDGNNIAAFEGIPYAEPPINEYRFKSTIKKRNWNSIIHAFNVGPQCLQLNPQKFFRVVGQEDCLYLNVYSPTLPKPNRSIQEESNTRYNRETNTTEKSLIPVIIWIHGGGFLFGSGGEYGPAYLLNRNVILVTFNYRLGILGFLSSGDDASPGNYGLKDQALAIEWVHENIEFFGGDPRRVIILGQSAGGASVHLQMLSNRARKYFHGAISMSGTAFQHWAIQSKTQARKLTIKVAKLFNCIENNINDPSTMNSTAMVSCLKRQNPVYLAAAQLNLVDWIPFPPILFGPVLESPNSPDCFIAETPLALYKRNNVAKIPWINSITLMEGHTVFLITDILFRTNPILRNFNEFAPIVLDFKYKISNPEQTRIISEEIANFYFANNEPDGRTKNELSDILTDRYFTLGFHKGLQYHSKIAPTYGYIFNYKGKYNLGNTIGSSSNDWGIGHAEDVFFIFNSSSTYSGFRAVDKEKELSSIMTNLFHNFADAREPLYTNQDGDKIKIWNTVNELSHNSNSLLQVLQINYDIKMIDEPFQKRIQFWEKLEREYNL